MTEKELYTLAEETVELLKQENLKIATAESCTGGMVSSYITSVSGVSEIFELGITSYSCKIKNEILSVKEETLCEKGAVSKETAEQMAINIRRIANSDLGISVTGVAGPLGSEGHPPGFVFIGLASKEQVFTKLLNITAKDREFVRKSAVAAVFELIQQYIKDNNNATN